jgi:hypothetical protein
MSIHTDPNAAHAVYAPSSAHRWTVCTASATAIAALGEQEEGDEAREGTAAHDEIERILGQFNGQTVEPDAIREASARLIDVDHPAAFGIALTLDYVAKLPRGRVWIEQRVALTDQIWGRCDIAHWHEESETLTIVDYKNGFVGVDAAENEQLRIYGAGSIYTYKLPAKWIRYAVIQPNDFRPGVPRVKQWIESADTLFAFAERTAAIPRGELKFVGVGEHCRDCPLFGMCEPSRDILSHLGTMMAGGPSGDVRPAQIPLFLACKKPIDHFFEGLIKAGTKKALAGDVPPGMKIVTATKHRTWKSEVDARAAVLAAKGVDALKPPTPAQAEEMGIDVATLATKPEGGPALAFESDKRPAWAPEVGGGNV